MRRKCSSEVRGGQRGRGAAPFGTRGRQKKHRAPYVCVCVAPPECKCACEGERGQREGRERRELSARVNDPTSGHQKLDVAIFFFSSSSS